MKKATFVTKPYKTGADKYPALGIIIPKRFCTWMDIHKGQKISVTITKTELKEQVSEK